MPADSWTFDFDQGQVHALWYRERMKPRRMLAALLVALGAVMLFAAPETFGGLIAIAAGVVVESVGIFLEKRQ